MISNRRMTAGLLDDARQISDYHSSSALMTQSGREECSDEQGAFTALILLQLHNLPTRSPKESTDCPLNSTHPALHTFWIVSALRSSGFPVQFFRPATEVRQRRTRVMQGSGREGLLLSNHRWRGASPARVRAVQGGGGDRRGRSFPVAGSQPVTVK